MGGSARHRRRAPRSPVRRPLVVLALAVAIVALAVAGTLFAVSERLGDDVIRVPDPFAALDPATRPAPTAAMTFLLVGTDSRAAEPTTGADATGQAFDGPVLAAPESRPEHESSPGPRDRVPEDWMMYIHN